MAKPLMRDIINRLFPLKVRTPIKNLVLSPVRWNYKKKLERSSFALPKSGIYVNYGGALPNKTNVAFFGGRVKLTHLSQFFPEHLEKFNILYLVSSVQTKFSIELIKWAKKKGVKFVWNQNGVAYPAWAGPDFKEVNYTMKELICQADFVLYQSRFCKESADHYLGPISQPWEIMYNCVDTEVFSPPAEQPNLNIWKILSIGTHVAAFRVISALETIYELRKRGHKVEFTLGGTYYWKNAMAEIQENVKRLNLGNVVDIHSSYTQKEAPSFFQNSHVILHPKYNDPCPTVPIESMACGVPVIGSDSGGMPELVGEEGGRLINVPKSWEKEYAPNPNLMADAVVDIMNNWEENSRKARQRAVKLFNKKNWLQEHRRIFEKLL